MLLVTVAHRLAECVRAHDTVARLGGDEFAVLLDPPSDRAETVAQRILASLSAPVLLEDGPVQLSASVGIGEVLRAGRDAEPASHALQQADLAMYAAKAAGKNRWRMYQPDDPEAKPALRRLTVGVLENADTRG